MDPEFDNDRKVLIDNTGLIACVEIGVYTVHVKDDYYIALSTGRANFLRFDEEDSWYYFGLRGEKPDWWTAEEYRFERSVFRNLVDVDYQYIDNVRTHIREVLGLTFPKADYLEVPYEVRSDFQKFYIKFKYGR